MAANSTTVVGAWRDGRARDRRRQAAQEEMPAPRSVQHTTSLVFFDAAGFADASCFAGCAVMAVAIIGLAFSVILAVHPSEPTPAGGR